MRLLLLSGNNSLSHVAKCLALRERLRERGHGIALAVSGQRSPFLRLLDVPHEIVPDIQEADLGAAPSIAWFKRPERFRRCVQAEVELIRSLAPDRILGVFRFTSAVSARITGVPYDALLCGCMLAQYRAPLGFEPGEAGCEKQYRYLRLFQDVCAPRVNRALTSFGLPPVSDLRELLAGERTFLWDPPEFSPLPPLPGVHRVGPIWWTGWPRNGFDLEAALAAGSPLAVVAFGTGDPPTAVAERLVPLLLRQGYGVVLAAGGQERLLGLFEGERHVVRFAFVPLQEVLPRAALLVCHGGQTLVFEALRQRVPVAVMPFQPEQAENGRCLERLGCGARLVPSVAGINDPYLYLQALAARSDGELATILERLTRDREIRSRLEEVSAAIRRYDGAREMARFFGP
jgi:UDP:flavonoid glycosyltransferase YjiC (YdhE family)